MNTSEIFNPAQRKQRVIENFLNSQFGLKLQAKGDAIQVQSMISKLINENHNIINSQINYQHDKVYVRNTMLIEALKHLLKEIAPVRTTRRVNEQAGEDLAQAELILVAQNMIDQLQKMAEDVAQMQTDDLMPLAEKMKQTFSQEQGNQFSDSADQTFRTLLDAVKAAKDELSNALSVLKGESPVGPTGEMEPSLTPDEEMGDQFVAVDSANGEEELPTGRELK